MQEEKNSTSAYFITFTYADNNCLRTDRGYLSLHKKHLQDFFKRLRISQLRGGNTKSLKYYTVGEYGGISFRPHYHAIIFNVQLELILKPSEITLLKHTSYDGKTPFQIQDWPHGHITIGQVSGASIGYTLKYVTKNQRVPVHKNDDRLPEFALMSKGLGLAYLTKAMIQWHMNDP